MINRNLVSISAASALLVLGACANPYRANFNATGDRYPTWLGSRLSAPAKNPRLIKSQDIRAEGWELFEDGFVMVGYAKFDGPALDTKLALEQGRKAGADVVVVQDRYSKTLTETVAVTQWSADETTEIRERGESSGRGTPRQYNRTTEIRTSRSPETVYVPKVVDYYEHAATFWRRLESPLFGAFVTDLTDELKQKLQSNRGLVVKAVMTDSPAFEADILKGDIIRQINGEPVSSARRFYEELIQKAGAEIEVSILRGKETLVRRLRLNPVQP